MSVALFTSSEADFNELLLTLLCNEVAAECTDVDHVVNEEQRLFAHWPADVVPLLLSDVVDLLLLLPPPQPAAITAAVTTTTAHALHQRAPDVIAIEPTLAVTLREHIVRNG